jgi:hypothetical protein
MWTVPSGKTKNKSANRFTSRRVNFGGNSHDHEASTLDHSMPLWSIR